MMEFQFQDQQFQLSRYPRHHHPSLRAWSAADEHILQYCQEQQLGGPALVCHDRFGFLRTTLSAIEADSMLMYASQKKAILQNLGANQLPLSEERLLLPLDELGTYQFGLLKVPKSLELFRFYLHRISEGLHEEGEVVAGFMTRHFSPQMLEIASHYFTDVRQSRAYKKSRLLHLKGKKDLPEHEFLTAFRVDNEGEMRSYPGVFASNKLDRATRLLLENLRLRASDQKVLDLGCGYGVIAKYIADQKPGCELHLMDDNYLALASAKENLEGQSTHFHFTDSLKEIEEEFDCIVSNPPFHFEHENNIEIPLQLFREAKSSLKPGGHFQLVANQHLNYRTHLRKLFPYVAIVAENQ
ncbi:MAG: methyltransferase, partial [Bacteroidota bacterium]